jgi:phage-related minor tail protein
MSEGFEAYKDKVEKGTLSIASITEKAMKGTEDIIVNMLTGVKTSFKSLVHSIMADLIRLQVQKNITVPLSNALDGVDFKSILGFAHGGRPPIGRPSIVGERGAELFVPDSAGTIIPNEALGSGGTKNVNISFNITANDTDGFDELLESRRGMIVNLINGAMNDRGILGVT